MKFMNSDYGYDGNNYANFAGGRNRNRTKSAQGVLIRGGAIVPYDNGGTLATTNKSKPKPKLKNQAPAMKGRKAPPTLREPGIARDIRSTAAGAKQGARNATNWGGQRGIRSNIAGAKQAGRDAVYAGKQGLRAAGRFAMRNKVGTGLAAAGALGAIGYGIARKMRSDKGKKRGNYSR